MAVKESIGFIGGGCIASALIFGLCDEPQFEGDIFIFDKHPEKMAALQAHLGERIEICDSAQSVVNNATILFPAISPVSLEVVAPTLSFREEQRIVHIAAGLPLSAVAPWYSPAHSIVRAVPLPFVAKKVGPIVLYGDDELCHELLGFVGNVVKVENERDLEVLASVTGVMVSYYWLVGEISNWCVAKGMSFKDALTYTSFMNETLSMMVRESCSTRCELDSMIKESTTPEGMNELALNSLRNANAFAPWKVALEKVGKRYGL